MINIYIYDQTANINDIYQEELDNILRGDSGMKTQNGFTLFEKTSEIGPWLKKQKVTRKITRLQVHHMDLPNYSTWEKTDKKVFDEPHFGRTQSLNDYGKKTWNYSDGHGKYIAQHFNVFPDGKITTGRHLNSTPIGIRGWNTNAICIEIYGDFDKGKDVMTAAQKKAVVALYGELCKRFKIKPSTSTIRPHCWFTARGTYLGKYDPSRSAKTCPGTNFMGYGCSTTGFAKFIKEVKAYIDGEESKEVVKEKPKEEKTKGIYRVRTDELNVRKGPGVNFEKTNEVHKGDAFTIVEINGNWGKLKSGIGWINLSYTEKVK